jgi:protoporphyrinogen oxidase
MGGGPAGLSAAYELARHGYTPIVLEADEVVGGLARTVSHNGFLFDIGGHRFFTKWQEAEELWKEILGPKLLRRPRLSRIYYRNRFFSYPLKPANALLGLGPIEALRVVGSYLWWHYFPYRDEQTFEHWVTNRFGKRLYEVFFKTYTEKVWGIPCSEIRADWAAQRIRGLSLMRAVRAAVLPSKRGSIRTLVEEFWYPERGPGQMWETLADQLAGMGHRVRRGRRVSRILHDRGTVNQVVTEGPNGQESFAGAHFISSIPMRELVQALEPAPDPKVCQAADSLRYRDFLLVALIVNRAEVCPDNWIYVHDPAVRVGRIQNFKNWSPAMVADPSKTCLGMEYFVFEKDELWSAPDQELVAMARREAVHLKLAKPEEISEGTVVRMPKAYPVYDEHWQQHVNTIRSYIEKELLNLQLVGRNGMHRYNNQDHSMMTAIYAARNITGAKYDLWAVNSDPEYHEEQEYREEQKTLDPALQGRPPYAEPARVAKAAKSSGSG